MGKQFNLYDMPMTRSIAETGIRLVLSKDWEGGGRCLRGGFGRLSSRGDENLLDLDVVVAAPLCEYTENQ